MKKIDAGVSVKNWGLPIGFWWDYSQALTKILNINFLCFYIRIKFTIN
jgi:hypothetical protein